jgi:hypothetical protein
VRFEKKEPETEKGMEGVKSALRSPWSCLMVFPHRFGSMFHAARLQEMG